jgi:hypothetical protein
MFDALAHYRNRILKFPARGAFYVRPEPGLAKHFTRVSKRGDVAGATAIFRIIGGPYAEDTPLEKMTPRGGGDYAGRVVNLDFFEVSPHSWRVSQDIEIVLTIADALDLQRTLPPGATLADILNAAARRLHPTTSNPTPARLLLTIEHKAGENGSVYASAIDAAIVTSWGE